MGRYFQCASTAAVVGGFEQCVIPRVYGARSGHAWTYWNPLATGLARVLGSGLRSVDLRVDSRGLGLDLGGLRMRAPLRNHMPCEWLKGKAPKKCDG
jgi:hypothetical protein